MTTTFGRRTIAGAPPAPRLAPPSPAPGAVDPRLQALAASVHGEDATKAELRDYLARRRAAVGRWAWLANGLYVAPVIASYGLGAPWPWLLPISAASLASRWVLKRARLRWAAQIEAEARTPAVDL